MMQNFLAFRDCPIIPLRRSPSLFPSGILLIGGYSSPFSSSSSSSQSQINLSASFGADNPSSSPAHAHAFGFVGWSVGCGDYCEMCASRRSNGSSDVRFSPTGGLLPSSSSSYQLSPVTGKSLKLVDYLVVVQLIHRQTRTKIS